MISTDLFLIVSHLLKSSNAFLISWKEWPLPRDLNSISFKVYIPKDALLIMVPTSLKYDGEKVPGSNSIDISQS